MYRNILKIITLFYSYFDFISPWGELKYYVGILLKSSTFNINFIAPPVLWYAGIKIVQLQHRNNCSLTKINESFPPQTNHKFISSRESSFPIF